MRLFDVQSSRRTSRWMILLFPHMLLVSYLLVYLVCIQVFVHPVTIHTHTHTKGTANENKARKW